jgi:hypothetical protein
MKTFALFLSLVAGLLVSGLALAQSGECVELSDAQIEGLVLRSYQYVAMFNVNNKFALDSDNPLNSGGYNRLKANTDLADHTVQAIARPNNDTLYVVAMVDVTKEPIVMELPAFDTTYAFGLKKDVPVDAFCSVTVYNADGYLEANDLGVNSYNNFSAKSNKDGSITIHFGGDPKSVNYLPITEGWNYAIRMYQPRKEILDGTWTFPSIQPVKYQSQNFCDIDQINERRQR